MGHYQGPSWPARSAGHVRRSVWAACSQKCMFSTQRTCGSCICCLKASRAAVSPAAVLWLALGTSRAAARASSTSCGAQVRLLGWSHGVMSVVDSAEQQWCASRARPCTTRDGDPVSGHLLVLAFTGRTAVISSPHCTRAAARVPTRFGPLYNPVTRKSQRLRRLAWDLIASGSQARRCLSSPRALSNSSLRSDG